MAEEREASVQLLKAFAPLDGLKRDNLAALAKKVSVRTMSAGRMLFKEGDTDKRTVWLVGGMLEIREGDRTVAMIRGGTPDARNPLYPKTPRPVTARAVEEISYLSIDSELLDVMITWDQTGTYEVSELQAQLDGAGSDDWMTTLLQTKAFHRIPPANIQAIFLRLQRTPFRAGEVVIKQGRRGLFLHHRERQVRRHSRDPVEPRRHQARGAECRRYIRRGSADCRGQAQRHRDDAHRRRAHAAQQAGFPRAHE